MTDKNDAMALLEKPDHRQAAARANAAAAMFLPLESDSDEPKWSSWMLEQLIESILNRPNGQASDVIRGFDVALQKHEIRLTQTLANLVKDLVTLTFAKAGAWYQSAEWGWAIDELRLGATPSQCYLLLYALPPDKAPADAIVAILRGLAKTPFFTQARNELSDDLERADVKALLHDVKIPQLNSNVSNAPLISTNS